MIYYITVNQKAIMDMGLSLDIIDMSVFHYMQNMMSSPNTEHIIDEDKVYFWISAKKIITDMPILGIQTERGVNKRIDALVAANFIVKYEKNKSLKKSYFRLGENGEKYILGTWNDCSKDYIINNNKEEIDKSISKKEEVEYEKIISCWNAFASGQKNIAKVERISEQRKNKIRLLLKQTKSNQQELMTFISTLPYADTWVLGNSGYGKWSISFDWLINNTNGWYVKGLEGGMHKNNRYMFDKIMKGEIQQEYQGYSKKEDKLIINGIEYE